MEQDNNDAEQQDNNNNREQDYNDREWDHVNGMTIWGNQPTITGEQHNNLGLGLESQTRDKISPMIFKILQNHSTTIY